MAQRSLLLDVSRLVWRAWANQLPTGIDRTCLAYIRHYRDQANAVVQRGRFTWALRDDVSRDLFDVILAAGADTSVRSHLLRVYWRALFNRSDAGSLTGVPYLNVGHTGLDNPGHSRWIQSVGVCPFYFVHDLIPLTHPEYCRRGEQLKHLRRMTALLTQGAGVIGNSQHTLDELDHFASSKPSLQMPPHLVAPLGVGRVAGRGIGDAPFSSLPQRPYFVLLGTIEGRKNHLLILNVWADLARRFGPDCPQLVIIGRRGWECEQAVDMLERCEAIQGHVLELPRCEDAELRAYMAGARALLFPSFVEGYGLPLVEALSLGTPVIASDLAVFRELANEIPDYLSPLDGVGWSRLVEDYARLDSMARAAQVERMQGWRTPRWRDHFTAVDQWLGKLGFTLQRVRETKPND